MDGRISIGSLVKVMVDHPDGTTTNTKGDVGVVTKIESYVTHPKDYTVHSLHSDFVYGRNQIEELTDEEARETLCLILTEGKCKL